jgi:hypothetical protein
MVQGKLPVVSPVLTPPSVQVLINQDILGFMRLKYPFIMKDPFNPAIQIWTVPNPGMLLKQA